MYIYIYIYVYTYMYMHICQRYLSILLLLIGLFAPGPRHEREEFTKVLVLINSTFLTNVK